MNRKLHNSMLAISSTGLVLLAGLMAAVSQPQDVASTRAEATAAAPAVEYPRSTEAYAQAAAARAEALEARSEAFEARLEQSASTSEMLAETAAFTVETATEAALWTAFEELVEQQAEVDPPADDRTRSHVRRSRAALALPYFSFAQGLRQNRS